MGIIVGYENEKIEIKQLRNMLLNPTHFREVGLKIPRGLIIHGEPGVGKTQLARSIAGDGIKIIELRAADCCGENVDDELENVFLKAKKNQPAIILLDELDKIAGEREEYYIEENSNINKMLLQELDSISFCDNILVVATCNNIATLGEALLRPGRFDRSMFIDLPDFETRKRIFEEYFGLIKMSKNLDFDYLARITTGYTGARIECLANEVGIYAVDKGLETITFNEVQAVMNRLLYESYEKNCFGDENTLKAIASHEAGHAVVALVLSPECIFGASIIPQGRSAGHTYFINKNTGARFVKDVEEEIVVLLGGHVAERVCGNYLKGSGNDLFSAIHKLEDLTIKDGAYGYEGTLRNMPSFDCEVGAEIKDTVSKIMVNKLNEFDKIAEKIITNNRPLFDEITNKLIENKVLSQTDLLELKTHFETKSYKDSNLLTEDGWINDAHPIKDAFAKFSKSVWEFLFG